MSYRFTPTKITKLEGIEDNATADLAASEIESLYEGLADTNKFTDADHSKLDGIESGATADQSDAEIKTAYENNANTNAFTDAEQSKLAGIEAAADVTDAANVDAAGAVMESDTSTASMSFVIDEDNMASDSATKVPTQQSVKAYVDSEVATALTSEMSFKGNYDASANSPDLDVSPSGVKKGDVYVVTAAGNFFTIAVEVGDMLFAKIDDAAVEADWAVAQANMTAASIKTQYESNSDTNGYTDVEKSKLAAIEASADVTDATNVAAAGAAMTTDTDPSAWSFVSTDTDFENDTSKLATRQAILDFVDDTFRLPVQNKSANFSVDAYDLYAVDASGGAITASLGPAATAGDGARTVIKKVDSSGNAVTIDADGSETIDGQLTIALSSQYESVTLVCDGSQWWIV